LPIAGPLRLPERLNDGQQPGMDVAPAAAADDDGRPPSQLNFS